MASLGGSDGKESACNAGGLDSIPWWGRSPGEGNSSPFQYSCLENSVDRGSWWAIVCGVAELDATEQLTDTHTINKVIIIVGVVEKVILTVNYYMSYAA